MAKKWEYKVVSLNSEDLLSPEEELLNSLGQEGWELVAVTYARVATPKIPANDYSEETVDKYEDESSYAYLKREVG